MNTVQSRDGKKLEGHLTFARHNYDNQQALIRMLDTKAGVMITLLVFLIAATLTMSTGVGRKLHFIGQGAVTSWAYVIAAGILVGSFLISVLCVERVIIPRSSAQPTISSGLMFAEDILKHSTPDIYHRAVVEADDALLFHNITIEIYQLATIVVKKMQFLRRLKWPIIVSFVAWAATTVLSVYILTWR